MAPVQTGEAIAHYIQGHQRLPAAETGRDESQTKLGASHMELSTMLVQVSCTKNGSSLNTG